MDRGCLGCKRATEDQRHIRGLVHCKRLRGANNPEEDDFSNWTAKLDLEHELGQYSKTSPTYHLSIPRIPHERNLHGKLGYAQKVQYVGDVLGISIEPRNLALWRTFAGGSGLQAIDSCIPTANLSFGPV